MTIETEFPTHVDQIDHSDLADHVVQAPYIPRPVMVKYLKSSLRGGTDLEQRLQGFLELHLKRITGLWAGRYRDADTRELLNPTTHVSITFDEHYNASFQAMLDQVMELGGNFDLLFVEPDPALRKPIRVWRATLEPLQSGLFPLSRDLDLTPQPLDEVTIELAPVPETRFGYNNADDLVQAQAWIDTMNEAGIQAATAEPTEPTTES
jgi:hypothetical protein